MLSLFPKCRVSMMIGYGITILFFAAFLFLGQMVPGILFLLLGLFAARFLAEYQALKQHQNLLSILYHQQDPAQFISVYEPLLQEPKLRDNVRFTMQTHLINADIASGSFEKALDRLDHMPAFPVSSEAFAKSLEAGNRCLIYCHLENTQEAQKYYDEFITYGESITKKQQRFSYIESKTVLTIRMKLLKNKCTKQDANDLRERLKQQITPLQKTEFQYLLGRVLLLLKEHAMAKEALKTAVSSGDQLFAARRAADFL